MELRYTAVNYLGNSPATSYQNSKLVCLNADLFFLFPRQIRQFIVLHEEGHIKLDTDNEIEADNYAFSKFKGSLPESHRWSILAISRVLPFTNKNQYQRLINMYNNTIIQESYEVGSSLEYEATFLDHLRTDLEEMNNKEWNEANAKDPVSGEIQPVRIPVEPVGEFVEIAREAWTKAYLNLDLSGYDLTILDKYPMPEDFVAYELDRNELVGPTATEGATDTATTMNVSAPAPPPATAQKIPIWVWIIGAVTVIYLIFKKR